VAEREKGVTEARSAYRQLRDLILRTELRPSEPLVESELMQRLGVGRTPLRDALRLLAHDGLVDIEARRGTRVSHVTIDDLQQIFEVREGVEELVGRLAAGRVTPAHLEELSSLIERVRASDTEASDVALDTQFHDLLLRIAANRYLDAIYGRLFDASLRIMYLTHAGIESRARQAETFEAVADALRRADGDRLADLLRAHVTETRGRVGDAIFSRRGSLTGSHH
jgi:GntR family transcriptional regulator, rspAB operon transcriptional repressor